MLECNALRTRFHCNLMQHRIITRAATAAAERTVDAMRCVCVCLFPMSWVCLQISQPSVCLVASVCGAKPSGKRHACGHVCSTCTRIRVACIIIVSKRNCGFCAKNKRTSYLSNKCAHASWRTGGRVAGYSSVLTHRRAKVMSTINHRHSYSPRAACLSRFILRLQWAFFLRWQSEHNTLVLRCRSPRGG